MSDSILWIAGLLAIIFLIAGIVPLRQPPDIRFNSWQSWVIGCITLAAAMATLVVNAYLNQRERILFEARQLSSMLSEMGEIEYRLDGARELMVCGSKCIHSTENGRLDMQPAFREIAADLERLRETTNLRAIGLWHLVSDLSMLQSELEGDDALNKVVDLFPYRDESGNPMPEGGITIREYSAHKDRVELPENAYKKLYGYDYFTRDFTPPPVWHGLDRIASVQILASLATRDEGLARTHPRFDDLCRRTKAISYAMAVDKALLGSNFALFQIGLIKEPIHFEALYARVSLGGCSEADAAYLLHIAPKLEDNLIRYSHLSVEHRRWIIDPAIQKRAENLVYLLRLTRDATVEKITPADADQTLPGKYILKADWHLDKVIRSLHNELDDMLDKNPQLDLTAGDLPDWVKGTVNTTSDWLAAGIQQGIWQADERQTRRGRVGTSGELRQLKPKLQP